MNPELRERREDTYQLLVAHGIKRSEVVARLSDQYGVTKTTIRRDIDQMPEWLPEISVDFGAGIVRLTRLRDQQQELERLALEAQREGNLNAAVGARREIRQAILAEEEIASRMGLAPEVEGEEEAMETEIEQSLSGAEEALLNEWSGVGDPVEIDQDGSIVLPEEQSD